MCWISLPPCLRQGQVLLSLWQDTLKLVHLASTGNGRSAQRHFHWKQKQLYLVPYLGPRVRQLQPPSTSWRFLLPPLLPALAVLFLWRSASSKACTAGTAPTPSVQRQCEQQQRQPAHLVLQLRRAHLVLQLRLRQLLPRSTC
jgi:hypothetical protein